MISIMKRFLFSIITITLIVNSATAQTHHEFFDPVALYLTWQQDPTTTMTIDWHVLDTNRTPQVDYREMDDEEWETNTKVTRIDFPWSERTVYRVELTGLKPATEYLFRFGPGSKQYSFRTMPSDASEPIRIAVGGDTMHRQEWMERTAREAMKYDLDFVLIGGDLAYADGLEPERQNHRDPQTPRAQNQWYSWFDAYKNSLITEDYRVVPMLVSIGNHEVRGGYYYRDDRRLEGETWADNDASRATIAPYFFSLFASPGQPGYGVIDFADYMSIVLLDTDHANPIGGKQTQWLEKVLSERTHIPHVFPVYHVPAYPSVRHYMDETMIKVREHWLPVFEKYGIQMVFENHDHAYKRTHPIRGGKVASNGIVYVGDGSWGTVTRKIGSRQDYEAWYIDTAAAERHAIIVTVHGTHRHMLTVNEFGEIIDEFPRTPRRGR